MKKINILFARNFTVEPLVDHLKEKLKKKNINCNFLISGYENSINEFLKNNSKVYKFKPNLIIFFYNLDVFFKIKKKNSFKKDKLILNYIKENFLLAIKSLNKNYNGDIAICNFTNSIFDNRKLQKYKKNLNFFIKDLANKQNNCSVIEIDHNYIKDINDIKFWRQAMYPFSSKNTDRVSHIIYKFICARNGKNHKLIITDADNTLWKGVIGEDTVNKIKVSNKGIYKNYYLFQKTLLMLKKRGIILALCTKNNFSDIQKFFNNKKMPLSLKDFTIIKSNWQKKSLNIFEILKKLNLNYENSIFIDDSDFEIKEVENSFPLIDTIKVPQNANKLSDILNDLVSFTNLSLTKEDKKRTEFYKTELERKQNILKFKDSDSYIKNLGIEIFIKDNNKKNIERLSQMTLKTNQFNTTTIRLNKKNILKYINSKEYLVSECHAKDKFGDYGVIGLSIIKILNEQQKAVVENCLFSCRALGRSIEEHFFQEIFNKLKLKNIFNVEFNFIKSQKNKPAYNFFINNRFKKIKKRKNIVFNCNLKKIILVKDRLIQVH